MATGKVNQRVGPRRLPLSAVVLALFFGVACPKTPPNSTEYEAPETYTPKKLMEYVILEGERYVQYDLGDALLYQQGKIKKEEIKQYDNWKITLKIPQENIPEYMCQRDFDGSPNVTFRIYAGIRDKNRWVNVEGPGVYDVGFNTEYLGTEITQGTGYWGSFYQGCDEGEYRDRKSISDGKNPHITHHFFGTLERLIQEGRVERVSQ